MMHIFHNTVALCSIFRDLPQILKFSSWYLSNELMEFPITNHTNNILYVYHLLHAYNPVNTKKMHENIKRNMIQHDIHFDSFDNDYSWSTQEIILGELFTHHQYQTIKYLIPAIYTHRRISDIIMLAIVRHVPAYILHYLIEYEQKYSNYNPNVLYYIEATYCSGNLACVKYMTRRFISFIQNSPTDLNRLINRALRNDHPEHAKWLIRHLNIKTPEGNRPLDIPKVGALSSFTPKVGASTGFTYKPPGLLIEHACWFGNINTLKFIIKRKEFDIHQEFIVCRGSNEYLRTPIQIAHENNQTKVVDYLRCIGCKLEPLNNECQCGYCGDCENK